MVGFEVVFEHLVFALEAAFGGGEVAQDEVVSFDFFGLPAADGRVAVADDVEVVFAFNAEATPFGLGGFDDEGIEDGVFGGVLVGIEPGLEEIEPVGFDFAGEDEGGGAHAVTGGVAGGGLATREAGWTGAAGIAFLGFGGGLSGFRVETGIFFVGKHMFLT